MCGIHVITLVLAWQLQRRRVSLPNLLRGGKCVFMMEEETSGEGLFSFERAVRWNHCRREANLERYGLFRGAGARQPGEFSGKGNYGKITRKNNAGLLVQHRSKQAHAFANNLPPAWSRVGNSFLWVTHQSSQLLGSLCCSSTGCFGSHRRQARRSPSLMGCCASTV